jgi:hypothetical protein
MQYIDPYTLLYETSAQKKEREELRGERQDGKIVLCAPYPDEPTVIRFQHRAVCLAQKYPGCATCPHAFFTLLFPEQPQREALVACPRWWDPTSRYLRSAPPDVYIPTEQATCEGKPFEFCSSCPNSAELEEMGVLKDEPGWYGRWKRLMEEPDDDE